MANVIWDADNADHRRAFATALAPLVSVLWKRAEPFSRVDAMIYMRILKSVKSAILVEAVEKALGKETWFPEPAKLLEYASEVVEARRNAVRDRWLGAECAICHGSRWMSVVIDGVERLTRCECWRGMLAAMDEVGSAPARKRLPARAPADGDESWSSFTTGE